MTCNLIRLQLDPLLCDAPNLPWSRAFPETPPNAAVLKPRGCFFFSFKSRSVKTGISWSDTLSNLSLSLSPRGSQFADSPRLSPPHFQTHKKGTEQSRPAAFEPVESIPFTIVFP